MRKKLQKIRDNATKKLQMDANSDQKNSLDQSPWVSLDSIESSRDPVCILFSYHSNLILSWLRSEPGDHYVISEFS